ncbi:MAG TPA: class I SAM-dependent methyltransferase, partial [Stellaceae bacterium]|nr:class I SAM-dependent methyltransferase [Stellaceae bacterium]
MERIEYLRLDEAEDGMWWFAALHANLALLLRAFGAGPEVGPLLDAGCGTGGLLARLALAFPERAALGLDAEPAACTRAAAKSGRPVCAGSVNALPFADGSFAAIVSA